MNSIQVQVVYAKLEHQTVVSLSLSPESTVLEAIQQSGLLSLLSPEEKETLSERVGIFGEQVTLSRALKNGDRVEIYRSLKKDPKQARRERAREQRSRFTANSRHGRS